MTSHSFLWVACWSPFLTFTCQSVPGISPQFSSTQPLDQWPSNFWPWLTVRNTFYILTQFVHVRKHNWNKIFHKTMTDLTMYNRLKFFIIYFLFLKMLVRTTVRSQVMPLSLNAFKCHLYTDNSQIHYLPAGPTWPSDMNFQRTLNSSHYRHISPGFQTWPDLNCTPDSPSLTHLSNGSLNCSDQKLYSIKFKKT